MMSEFVRLIEFNGDEIRRGAVFRVRAVWPYESAVDFLVFETSDSSSSYGLMVSSGSKAGLTLVHLPKAADCLTSPGLSTQWVRKNWSDWIYPDCALGDVFISNGYVAVPVLG